MAEELDAETIAYAHRMFNLARTGGAAELAGQLAHGLPANLTNEKGDTLLILAAYHNHPGTVAALLEQGADPARVNDRGQTALAAAVFRRNAETVTLLLAAGARPEDGNPSALATAAFFNLPEMAALLQGRPQADTAEESDAGHEGDAKEGHAAHEGDAKESHAAHEADAEEGAATARAQGEAAATPQEA
ncbi:ankyrin repeat domain-containing protein [Actinoplanes sp. N902-109]|uniref:ankyrin repeat domain-containing protein n=1 Tax=Actinoplanes sp. (strain N902-109) TaxID=649831 RepID=UPI0003A9A78B|nr:ankyrin repeat domain-containing protein [Actinoplanes sp. N902-109]